MNIEDLGIGSIVEINDNLYRNTETGWVLLMEGMPAYMGGVPDDGFTVLREEEKGPLDDFVKGDVIAFDGLWGPRVAVKHRRDFWALVGTSAEYTNDGLADCIADLDSIRKVGSLDG